MQCICPQSEVQVGITRFARPSPKEGDLKAAKSGGRDSPPKVPDLSQPFWKDAGRSCGKPSGQIWSPRNRQLLVGKCHTRRLQMLVGKCSAKCPPRRLQMLVGRCSASAQLQMLAGKSRQRPSTTTADARRQRFGNAQLQLLVGNCSANATLNDCKCSSVNTPLQMLNCKCSTANVIHDDRKCSSVNVRQMLVGKRNVPRRPRMHASSKTARMIGPTLQLWSPLRASVTAEPLIQIPCSKMPMEGWKTQSLSASFRGTSEIQTRPIDDEPRLVIGLSRIARSAAPFAAPDVVDNCVVQNANADD